MRTQVTLTTLVPEELMYNTQTPITITTPDGFYEVLHFPTGQRVGLATFWYAVRRQGDPLANVFTTTLEEAMGWFARRMLETCF